MTVAKPAEKARRDGNPGKRPIRDPVILGGRAKPTAPAYLRPSMARVFRSVTADLEAGGVLAHLDGQAITRYAIAQGMVAEIATFLKERDLIEALSAETVRGTARSPLITTLLALLTEARQIGHTLGDNPSARASLGLAGVESTDDMDAQIGPPSRLRVVGAIDGPQLAMVHTGETIIPAGGRG